MAEKGHWKYSAKNRSALEESDAIRSSTLVGSKLVPKVEMDESKGTYCEKEGTYTTARQRRLQELLSDSAPIRSSLMRAQEHALASLIDATKSGIEWEHRSALLRGPPDERREKAMTDDGNGGTPEKGSRTNTISSHASSPGKEELADRLSLLMKMQAEHERQMRCIKATEDNKNLITRPATQNTTTIVTSEVEGKGSSTSSSTIASPPRLAGGKKEVTLDEVAAVES